MAITASVMGSGMSRVRRYCGHGAAAVFLAGLLVAAWMAVAESWKTNFEVRSVDLGEIMSGGPPKDGIPPIDDPKFEPLSAISHLADTEPVVSVIIGEDARAYPLQVLMWHEIVNDTVGGVPISVTFCPLCNAAVVFDRRLEGMVLDFGTTGSLRIRIWSCMTARRKAGGSSFWAKPSSVISPVRC